MKTFNLKEMTVHSYNERDKNVFYKADEFKVRIIELPSRGEMPTCEMADHVLFTVVSGSADVFVDGEITTIREGQMMITPPATLSMKTRDGVRIVGVQIRS